MQDVLRHRRDEATVIDPPTGSITMPIPTTDGAESADEDTEETEEEGDWRLNV